MVRARTPARRESCEPSRFSRPKPLTRGHAKSLGTVVDGYDVGLGGESFLGRRRRTSGRAVAAVGQDGETVVLVRGFTQSGKCDTAGGNAGQDKVVIHGGAQKFPGLCPRTR